MTVCWHNSSTVPVLAFCRKYLHLGSLFCTFPKRTHTPCKYAQSCTGGVGGHLKNWWCRWSFKEQQMLPYCYSHAHEIQSSSRCQLMVSPISFLPSSPRICCAIERRVFSANWALYWLLLLPGSPGQSNTHMENTEIWV